MAEFRNELARLAERGTRVGPELLIERIEADLNHIVEVPDPILSSLPPRGSRPWVWAVLAAAVVALLFLPFLLNRGASNMIDDPDISTTITVVDPTAAEALAESFMEAWVAGHGEAAATMFSAEATLGFWGKPSNFPALHDWYRAVGQEFHSKGCETRSIRVGSFQGVRCEYTFDNKLTRAIGIEPVRDFFILYIGGGRIESAHGYFYQSLSGSLSSAVDGVFIDWLLDNHLDDFEPMYRPLLDPAALALWEQYTDEFVASPEAAAQYFMERHTRAAARAAANEKYLAPAFAICEAATDRFDAAAAELGLDQGYFGLEEMAAEFKALVRISEEALADLRALPSPPEAAAGLFDKFFSLVETRIDIFHQVAAAASAGDSALVETLGTEGLMLKRQMERLGLEQCPVHLAGG